jgi:Amt family ammonium transporter
VLLCGCLVFWMHAGFATLEVGFARRKNTVNILAKNFMVVALSSISFYLLGFGFMFGDGNAFIGASAFVPAFDGTDVVPGAPANLPLSVFFFFQLVFAATAASIVSGAVAERIRIESFLVFSFLLVSFVYPIVGHWIWGGGFLAQAGFKDFAGSTAVHSVGGWAALMGAWLLGPRLGKYTKSGKVRPILGHSMPLATIGTFILWLGWFGFNAGSALAATPELIGKVALSTNMAAAAGAVVACLTALRIMRSFDLSMILNGALAGLVAITAGCDVIGPAEALLVGGIAGLVVVLAVIGFDRIRIDDPVGATSVHLVCGIFGTLAVGLFAKDGGLFHGGGADLLLNQLLGIGAVAGFVLATSALLWLVVKAIFGLRVSAEDELVGLDIAEMKMEAYPADTVGPGSAAADEVRELQSDNRDAVMAGS